MRRYLKFYINGKWVEPAQPKTFEVINPATETVCAQISLGSSADVDRAVQAAREAFKTFSQTSREERIKLLERIVVEFDKRLDDIATAITEEMGAPVWLAQGAQATMGSALFVTASQILKDYEFEEHRGTTVIVKEPIGVCGFITPWNWPINQVVCKVAPALATGCTIVLKPSEIAPLSGQIFAEILAAAGVPPGVFNLVNGDGPTVGAAISSHPDVDMVSITGSTRAGIEVAKNAAPTVKRVCQELGGKSPNIILEDADMKTAIADGVRAVMTNSGQSCNAPTRMIVPRNKMEEVIGIAKTTADATTVGDPNSKVQIGPVVSEAQWRKVQGLIQRGIDEGATLVAGGTGKPDGLKKGYFVKPTVFANVTNNMTIAREEIFGPVLPILAYGTVEEAVEIGNDTEYGLAAYVSGRDWATMRKVASRLRAGQVNLNSTPFDPMAPFGGYKRSGNGREWGDHAFAEFLETKAILGVTSQGVAK